MVCLFQAMLSAISLAVAMQSPPQATPLQEVISARQNVIVKLFGAGAGSVDSYGTGIIVSPDGHVLTVWNHLVSTGVLTAVTIDGRRFALEIVGTSSDYDAALLKLKSNPQETFDFLDLRQAIDPEIGTPVLAFSNMFRVAAGNEPVSVVHGVIAASVPLEATQGRWKFPVKSPVWVIDAISNNSGAAGGLLTDRLGRPVGLLGREIRHAASRTWINYAVPLTILEPVVESLKSGKKLESTRPKDSANIPLMTDQELTSRFGLIMLPNVVERTPAFVDQITPNSVAAESGLRRGDLIVLIEDSVVTSVTELQQQFATTRSGQEVSVTVNRNQELKTIVLRIP